MLHEHRDYTPGLLINVHSIKLLPTSRMKRLKLSGFNDFPRVTWLDCGSQEINQDFLIECIFEGLLWEWGDVKTSNWDETGLPSTIAVPWSPDWQHSCCDSTGSLGTAELRSPILPGEASLLLQTLVWALVRRVTAQTRHTRSHHVAPLRSQPPVETNIHPRLYHSWLLAVVCQPL